MHKPFFIRLLWCATDSANNYVWRLSFCHVSWKWICQLLKHLEPPHVLSEKTNDFVDTRKLLNRYNDKPGEASRAFDKDSELPLCLCYMHTYMHVWFSSWAWLHLLVCMYLVDTQKLNVHSFMTCLDKNEHRMYLLAICQRNYEFFTNKYAELTKVNGVLQGMDSSLLVAAVLSFSRSSTMLWPAVLR